MPKRITPLTDTKVRTTKPAGKLVPLFDGGIRDVMLKRCMLIC